ncbi:MAG TPA: hypothetical protein VFJ15_04800 [Oleiagrimonas sp.]|nr:hypothetical protein [Oleiagrimonas sp.]
MLHAIALALAVVIGTHATVPTPVVELFEPGTISTGRDDAHISFSADGTSAWFLCSSPDFVHWTVVVSHQRDGQWHTPRVAVFSGRYSDADVSIDYGKQRMFFISNRPLHGHAARPDTDIWTMPLDANGPGTPHHVAALSSTGNEWFPTMGADGWLYFGSERHGGHGQSDLWRAHWDGQQFQPPENLGPMINTPGQEIEAFPDPQGRFLIFSAKGRQPSAGAYDLYVTWRCHEHWTPPQQLGAGINTRGWEFGARISPNGRYLYFTSNRNTFDPHHPRYDIAALNRRLHSPGNGLNDIYRVPVEALDLQPPCAKAAADGTDAGSENRLPGQL